MVTRTSTTTGRPPKARESSKTQARSEIFTDLKEAEGRAIKRLFERRQVKRRQKAGNPANKV